MKAVISALGIKPGDLQAAVGVIDKIAALAAQHEADKTSFARASAAVVTEFRQRLERIEHSLAALENAADVHTPAETVPAAGLIARERN